VGYLIGETGVHGCRSNAALTLVLAAAALHVIAVNQWLAS